MRLFVSFLFASLPATVSAESSVKKDVLFSITEDVGFGNEVCVLGNHPDLGGGDPLRAPKLAWSPGNVWRGKIALEADTTFSFSYIRRSYGAGVWGNSTNQVALGAVQTLNSPGHVAPPWRDKCLIFRSSFSQAFILFRDVTRGGPWTEAPMRIIGPGRTAGESTFRVDGLAPSGSLLEFVFHNGAGTWNNAPSPPSGASQGAAPSVPVPYQGLGGPYNYLSPLDVLAVQDGQVFNYLPPSTVSAPRMETRQISSTIAGIPGRPIRILLPRGYDTHPAKRYPVIYFHDGQNVFFPGGPFGTWDADRIANHETSQGRMRECILVSIPNGNEYGSNRISEYTPTGDSITYAGTVYQGKAGDYARFLLDNVMPTLDQHYRTLGNAGNTLTAGSSMGGLVSDYIGFSHSERFGTLGVFSPAYWAAPNWVALRNAAMKLPVRRYLYMGTAESSTGESSSDVYWRGALQAYDAYLSAGHVSNGDLHFEGGAGAAHNEAAWSRRLPAFFSFALDPMQEASPLAQSLFPPGLEIVPDGSGHFSLRYMGFLGARQTIEQGNLINSFEPVLELPAESSLWEIRSTPAPMTLPLEPARFWRMKQEAWPGR